MADVYAKQAANHETQLQQMRVGNISWFVFGFGGKWSEPVQVDYEKPITELLQSCQWKSITQARELRVYRSQPKLAIGNEPLKVIQAESFNQPLSNFIGNAKGPFFVVGVGVPPTKTAVAFTDKTSIKP